MRTGTSVVAATWYCRGRRFLARRPAHTTYRHKYFKPPGKGRGAGEGSKRRRERGVFISLTIYERMKRRRAHEKMHVRDAAVDPEHPFYRSARFGTKRKRRTPRAHVAKDTRRCCTHMSRVCLYTRVESAGPPTPRSGLARARDSRYPDGRGTMWRDVVQNTRPARRFSGRAALFITTAAGAQAATLCRHGRSRSQNPRDTAGQISFYYTCGVSAVG